MTPKPEHPLEVIVRIWRNVDGTWSAEAKAGDMVGEAEELDSGDQAAAVAMRDLYSTAVALGREEWFWR